jgi:hypothetical protein
MEDSVATVEPSVTLTPPLARLWHWLRSLWSVESRHSTAEEVRLRARLLAEQSIHADDLVAVEDQHAAALQTATLSHEETRRQLALAQTQLAHMDLWKAVLEEVTATQLALTRDELARAERKIFELEQTVKANEMSIAAQQWVCEMWESRFKKLIAMEQHAIAASEVLSAAGRH